MFRKPPASRQAQGPRPYRPQVEPLEPRLVPSTFTVLTAADSGPGSLRQAILDADAQDNTLNPGAAPDRIVFAIPGRGLHTVAPASPLPDITDPVVLDATTQPGFAGRPVIVLDGSQTFGDGLHITGGGSTVRGLVIDGFGGAGIAIDTQGGNVIEGNYLGTDPTGTAARGNAVGISVQGGPNRIGTDGQGPNAAAKGNLISGNTAGGVVLLGGFQPGDAGPVMDRQHNLVAGNRIGTDVTGTRPLGNGTLAHLRAVVVAETRTQTVTVYRTVQKTVCLPDGTCTTVEVQVPVHVVETVIVFVFQAFPEQDASGRGGDGVTVFGNDNQVGGPGALANTIAFNAGAGVAVGSFGAEDGPPGVAFTGNSIRGNSIDANTGPGIDLGADGVTPDGPGHAATSANDGQNFPTLLRVERGDRTRVAGTLNSRPDTTFTLDFYAGPTADPSGFGQGRRYLGSTTVTTDHDGNASFDVRLAASTESHAAVSATATDPDGNTSEFSFALCGEARARVVDGRLLIGGAGPGTNVRIAPGPDGPGSFQVTDGDGTATFRGVTRGITIDLGRGGAVFVDGSPQPLTVGGDVKVHTGSGAGAVWMVGVSVQGRTEITRGSGGAAVHLIDAAFAGPVTIATRAGADLVQVDNSAFQGPVAINTGAGPDRVLIDTHADPARPPSAFAARVDLRTGPGDDRIEIGSLAGDPVSFLGLLAVDGGDGQDSLLALNTVAPDRQIQNVEQVIFPPGDSPGP